MFRLTLASRPDSEFGGKDVTLLYDPHTSSLTDETGRDVLPRRERTWSDATRVSPDAPGRKQGGVRRLKIQLGLGCNYSCSYCLQGNEIAKASRTSIRDAERFLDGLSGWLTGAPERIEFWGGEPLLYWPKIAALAPELRRRFPDVEFLMITNGSLLTREIVDRIVEWNITGAISHDGPGQHVRGPDPFAGEARDNIRYLMDIWGRRGKFSFNAVLTPASYDVDAVIDWFWERWGEVPVGFEGVVHAYGNDPSARFTAEQLDDLTRRLTLSIIYGTAFRSASIAGRVERTMNALIARRPSSALGQKCGMDRDDQIAVDLVGNVMTCQNTGAGGRHRLGHVSRLDEVRLATSWHWSHRQECRTCPVLQQCAGACMYNEGPGWAASCHAEFAFNKAILASALFHLTSLVLKQIDGRMIRPEVRPQAAAGRLSGAD